MIYEDVIITTDDKNFEYKLIDQFTKSINIRIRLIFFIESFCLIIMPRAA